MAESTDETAVQESAVIPHHMVYGSYHHVTGHGYFKGVQPMAAVTVQSRGIPLATGCYHVPYEADRARRILGHRYRCLATVTIQRRCAGVRHVRSILWKMLAGWFNEERRKTSNGRGLQLGAMLLGWPSNVYATSHRKIRPDPKVTLATAYTNGPGWAAISKTVIVMSPGHFKVTELPAYAQGCPTPLDSTPVKGRWALVPFQHYQT
ncbi:hypothetical protein SCLCIDRAFT_9790 [Scleroderma citrinum Foug A]|uniref:Uncharacterized protein n=1 Tax=Scleroderma citrinum Foug A TaxID=1036808 RepID=A0A0C3DW37_9AGAM|nr:hypothetical protein SCLCIDRAFT_9790 [Scleroderma citrinum Foug A]